MRPFLSTIGWGAGIDRRIAFDLLDRFVSRGGTYIRTATHYPSVDQTSAFGKSNEHLQAWLQANPHSKPKILCEIGAMGHGAKSPVEISSATLLTMVELARGQLFGALWGISIAQLLVGHESTESAIMRALKGQGLRLATTTTVGNAEDEGSSSVFGDDCLFHVDASNIASVATDLYAMSNKSVIIEANSASDLHDSKVMDVCDRFPERIFGVCIRPTSLDSLDRALTQFGQLTSYDKSNDGHSLGGGSVA